MRKFKSTGPGMIVALCPSKKEKRVLTTECVPVRKTRCLNERAQEKNESGDYVP